MVARLVEALDGSVPGGGGQAQDELVEYRVSEDGVCRLAWLGLWLGVGVGVGLQ